MTQLQPTDEMRDRVRDLQNAIRHLSAELIANSPRLCVPFTNAPHASPWPRVATRLSLVMEAADAVEAAVSAPAGQGDQGAGETTEES